MGNFFRYSMLLGKRWMWVLLIGTVLSGGAAYLISTFLHPAYQASAYLIIDLESVAHSDSREGWQALQTFAQSIKTPAVLDPVARLHAGMTARELAALISIKPRASTQIIELDVQADNPRLAADLADQVSQSFARYTSNSSSGTVRIVLAPEPSLSIQPYPLVEAGIGVVIGFCLMLILVILFEGMGNRATGVEQIQELLAAEIMALVPCFSRRSGQQAPSEKYHMICASLNVARANQPFKLVMFTSALAGEGKSTIACNVAIHLAQAGKQVLLVDLNAHRPALAQLFRLNNQFGLTNLLAGKNEQLPWETYSQITDIAGLRVLTSGSQRMNFPEMLQALLAAQFFSHLQQTEFDYIIFDAPPLFTVAETRIMASSMEAIVWWWMALALLVECLKALGRCCGECRRPEFLESWSIGVHGVILLIPIPIHFPHLNLKAMFAMK